MSLKLLTIRGIRFESDFISQKLHDELKIIIMMGENIVYRVLSALAHLSLGIIVYSLYSIFFRRIIII